MTTIIALKFMLDVIVATELNLMVQRFCSVGLSEIARFNIDLTDDRQFVVNKSRWLWGRTNYIWNLRGIALIFFRDAQLIKSWLKIWGWVIRVCSWY